MASPQTANSQHSLVLSFLWIILICGISPTFAVTPAPLSNNVKEIVSYIDWGWVYDKAADAIEKNNPVIGQGMKLLKMCNYALNKSRKEKAMMERYKALKKYDEEEKRQIQHTQEEEEDIQDILENYDWYNDRHDLIDDKQEDGDDTMGHYEQANVDKTQSLEPSETTSGNEIRAMKQQQHEEEKKQDEDINIDQMMELQLMLLLRNIDEQEGEFYDPYQDQKMDMYDDDGEESDDDDASVQHESDSVEYMEHIEGQAYDEAACASDRCKDGYDIEAVYPFEYKDAELIDHDPDDVGYQRQPNQIQSMQLQDKSLPQDQVHDGSDAMEAGAVADQEGTAAAVSRARKQEEADMNRVSKLIADHNIRITNSVQVVVIAVSAINLGRQICDTFWVKSAEFKKYNRSLHNIQKAHIDPIIDNLTANDPISAAAFNHTMQELVDLQTNIITYQEEVIYGRNVNILYGIANFAFTFSSYITNPGDAWNYGLWTVEGLWTAGHFGIAAYDHYVVLNKAIDLEEDLKRVVAFMKCYGGDDGDVGKQAYESNKYKIYQECKVYLEE